MNKLVLAASIKSVIYQDKLTFRQFINIGLAQKKFNEMFANTNYHAEIVTSDNLNYSNLIPLNAVSDSRQAGFYENGKVKVFLATRWITDIGVYPDASSKKIFTSYWRNPTDHISIGTFLGIDDKDLC